MNEVGDRVHARVRDPDNPLGQIWEQATVERVFDGAVHVRFDDGTKLIVKNRTLKPPCQIHH